MPYFNCPACHLSVETAHGPFDECPRCRKREDSAVPMFVSPLPYRLLAGPIFQTPAAAAER